MANRLGLQVVAWTVVNVAANQLTTDSIIKLFGWFHRRFDYEQESEKEIERWRQTMSALTEKDLKRACKTHSKLQSDAQITRRRMTRPVSLELFYNMAVNTRTNPPERN